MMTRLIVNLSQVYIPLYVTDSLFLDKVCHEQTPAKGNLNMLYLIVPRMFELHLRSMQSLI